jgi:hypothetical protein
MAWEYQDFVFSYPAGSRPSRIAISIVQTRYDIWMNVKPQITAELQKWIDNGWEPVGDIDQSGLRWRSYKQMHVEPISIILIPLVLGLLLLLFDLMSPRECEEVTEYRLSMRRLKP